MDSAIHTGLPTVLVSRTLRVRDLDMRVLEAGDPSSPLVLLLHGFPELSWSWRRVMLPLASAGYHVIAPDQRGYGRTTSCNAPNRQINYDDDISSFRMTNLVHDIVALVFALGHKTVAGVVGHDFGSVVAAYCALVRPDLFKSVVMMSAPFPGPPTLPTFADTSTARSREIPIWSLADQLLAGLNPPRKHYTSYFSGRAANDDMLNAPQGLRAFLRAYFHVKSGDWPGNNPYPLKGAVELSDLPHYYVMPLQATMAEVVQRDAPSAIQVSQNDWLPDAELEVYAMEFGETGFQGGLNWYRCKRDDEYESEWGLFAGKKIEPPAMFLSGEKDWGVYQIPGSVEKMREACKSMSDEDFVLIEGAGHWVQQEKSEAVIKHLLRFLGKAQVGNKAL